MIAGNVLREYMMVYVCDAQCSKLGGLSVYSHNVVVSGLMINKPPIFNTIILCNIVVAITLISFHSPVYYPDNVDFQ